MRGSTAGVGLPLSPAIFRESLPLADRETGRLDARCFHAHPRLRLEHFGGTGATAGLFGSYMLFEMGRLGAREVGVN
jgi:hypothetical protein